ncbi:hypothetical protein D3C87_1571820 [compost metagenome]
MRGTPEMRFEHTRLLLIFNTRATVHHGQPCHLRVTDANLAGFYPDGFIGRRIFDGVVNQVAHHDAGQRTVAKHGQGVVRLNHQRMSGVGLHRRRHVARQFSQVGMFASRRPGLIAQAVLIQQLIHQFRHACHRAVDAGQARVDGLTAVGQNHVQGLRRRTDGG